MSRLALFDMFRAKRCANCAYWSVEKLRENYVWRDAEGWGECQAIHRDSSTAILVAGDDASLYTESTFSCCKFSRVTK